MLIILIICPFIVSCGDKRQSRSHQKPYVWDSYNIPDIEFDLMPVNELVDKINKEVEKASNGKVKKAIVIDSTPAKIVNYSSDKTLSPHIEQMIEDYRKNEKEMAKKGARGYETTLYSGPFQGNHSFCCLFMGLDTGLKMDPKEDALYLRRNPDLLECRVYSVSAKLEAFLEQLQKQKHMHVNIEPIVSAFIRATDYSFHWGVDIPTGHNSWASYSYPDITFKYIPDSPSIIVIATPDEHKRATDALKKKDIGKERKNNYTASLAKSPCD